MSVFRPSARATSPDGREWEIYAYKVRWTRPARVRDIPRTLAAALATLRGDDWTIDAVTHDPRRQSVITWRTTTEHKGQVLAQIAGHLARGDIALRLTHADYLGEDRRSAR